MPQADDRSLPPLIQDLILDHRIQTLEEALVYAERVHPADPSLPAGRCILDIMLHEQARRQNAYAAMLDAGPEEMDALIAVENVRRERFHQRPAEFQWGAI